MQFKVELNNHKDASWFQEEGLHIKGYASHKDGQKLKGSTLGKFLLDKTNLFPVEQVISELNGIFSFILVKNNELYAYSDPSRFYTLFYATQQDETVIISDQAHHIQSTLSRVTIDSVAEHEFKGFGFTIGSKTLIQEIKQIQSSELLHFTDGHIKSKILFSYATDKFTKSNYKFNADKAIDIIYKAFERTLDDDEDTIYCVPLSGGYDSRLIAVMLKKLGVKNVVCFTFGKPGKEVRISEKVATNLGFPWFFIEHNMKNIDDLLPEHQQLLDHVKYSSNLSSMFYMSEVLSAEFLKQNILPKNHKVIFLPGHCGDVLGGSQYIKTYPANIQLNRAGEQIVKSKYIYAENQYDQKKSLLNDINEALSSKADPRSAIEDWDLREKHCKMNVNSSKVYAWSGYEVRFPFWDSELIDFFKHLPFEFKKGKAFYNDILTSNFFEPMEVKFTNEVEPSLLKIKFQNLKDHMKKLLGKSWNKQKMQNTDWVNYQAILKHAKIKPTQFTDEIAKHNLNAHMIQWYLEQIKKEL